MMIGLHHQPLYCPVSKGQGDKEPCLKSRLVLQNVIPNFFPAASNPGKQEYRQGWKAYWGGASTREVWLLPLISPSLRVPPAYGVLAPSIEALFLEPCSSGHSIFTLTL